MRKWREVASVFVTRKRGQDWMWRKANSTIVIMGFLSWKHNYPMACDGQYSTQASQASLCRRDDRVMAAFFRQSSRGSAQTEDLLLFWP